MACSVPDTGDVVVVPALTGLGAPWWQPDALAGIEGIGPATQPAHVVRSTVEGLAAQVALLARAVAADLGRPLARLRVDGGLTRSRLLMQMQADLLQVPVEVAASPHATVAGVGALPASVPNRAAPSTPRSDGPSRPPATSRRCPPTRPPNACPASNGRWRGALTPARIPVVSAAPSLRRRHHRRRGGRRRPRSELARYRLRTVILERAVDVGTGTSKANTAIVHTGFDTEPGSLASTLVRRGHQLLSVLRARGGHRARGDGGRPGGLGRGTRGTARRRALQSTGQRVRTGHPAGARRTATARTAPRTGGHRGRRHPRRVDHLPREPEIAFAIEVVGAGVELRLGTAVTDVAATSTRAAGSSRRRRGRSD